MSSSFTFAFFNALRLRCVAFGGELVSYLQKDGLDNGYRLACSDGLQRRGSGHARVHGVRSLSLNMAVEKNASDRQTETVKPEACLQEGFQQQSNHVDW